jgi:autotransporter-associated beta strand protein
MGLLSTGSFRLPRASWPAALLIALLAPSTTQAQPYTWNQPATGGAWATNTNWLQGGVVPPSAPNAASAVAIFGNVLTANNTVNLPAGGVTIGELRFEDVNTRSQTVVYTIAAGQTITFDNGSSASLISVTGHTRANQTIAAAINVATVQGLTITNDGAPMPTFPTPTATLTLSGALSAANANTPLTVGGQANTTISGAIGANFGTLTKNGTGVLTLNAANAYTGGVVINGGTVNVSVNDRLGAAAGTVTLNGGAIHFTANNFASGRNFIIGANGGTFLSSVAPNILTGQTATLTGSITGGAGTGPVRYDGGQFLELRGDNTYTGATIVNNAGLMLTNGGRLSGTASITINGFNGGQIGIVDLLNGGAPHSDRLNDSAPITLNGGLLSYLAGTGSATNEVAGDLTVKGYGLIFGNHQASAAFGSLAFGAINRFDNFSTLYVGGSVNGPSTGSIQITFTSGLAQEAGSGTQTPVVPWIGGDLGLNDSGNIRATAIAETLYTYNDTFGLIALNSSNYEQIAGGAAMVANRNNSLGGNPAAVNSPLSILALIVSPTAPATGVTVTGSSTLTVSSGAIANTLPLVFDGPTLAFGTNTGYLWLGDNFTVQGTSQITGSNGLVVSSNLDNQFNNLRLRNAANTFTGGLYLNGTARADFNTSDAQLGAAGQVISFRGGELLYTGSTSITLETSGTNRPLVMSAAGGGVINVQDAAVTLTVPGLVSGAEQLTKEGSGTLVLSNLNNTHAGGTTLGVGTLAIAGPGSLGTGALTLGRPGGGPTTLRFDFAGTVSANVTQAVSTATLNTNGNNVTLSGVVSGNGTGLTKAGAGTLTLSGANTYTGNTTVNAGRLLVTNTTGLGTGYGNVTVATGAEFGGTSTVAGSLTVNGTGRLIVGMPTGPGRLTARGTTTLASTSTFQVTLNGNVAGTGYSQLVITSGGSINLGGATLDRILTYTPNAADRLFLIDNQNGGPGGTTGLTGTFAGLAQGATVTFPDGTTAVISYTGDFASQAISGGNDVVLHSFVPVPEPATVLGIGALALGGLMWRGRRKTAI